MKSVLRRANQSAGMQLQTSTGGRKVREDAPAKPEKVGRVSYSAAYIWTDRICLNQHNDDEMAQQVPRIGEIFRNATRVFAWLGMSEHQGQHLKPFLDLYRDGEDPREHPCAPETPLAVAAIANNEYWTRVWILQEFALAKQVVVVVGDVETTTEELDVIEYCFRGLHIASWRQMKRVLNLRRSEGGVQQLREMLPIMVSSDNLGCKFQSKRLHDRVYGVLGLLADHMDGTSPVDYIDVDYSKPTAEVILDALLESRVPTEEEYFLTCTAGMLLEWGNIMMGNITIEEPLHELFKKYLRSNRTSERHKSLARLAMQSYDALNGLLWLMTSNANSNRFQEEQPPDLKSMRGLFGRILRSFDPVLMPTPQQSAIMIGLALVSEINCQRPRTSDFVSAAAPCPEPEWTSPVWRCKKHQVKYPEEEESRNYAKYPKWITHGERGPEPVGATGSSEFNAPNFNLRHFAKACPEYSASQPCNASTMLFKIPEVGFRLTFQVVQRAITGPWHVCLLGMGFNFWTDSDGDEKMLLAPATDKPLELD
ncbi:heterokaryon incompatibility protein-domain-containing protein [Phyllosticta capitalensis]